MFLRGRSCGGAPGPSPGEVSVMASSSVGPHAGLLARGAKRSSTAEPRRRTRTPISFDAATGLSSREADTPENVIEVKHDTILWLFRKPWNNARGVAWRYFHGPRFPFSPRYHLDPTNFGPFASDALRRLDKKRLFTPDDQVRFEHLKTAHDTTYLIIRGLAILPLFHWFPSDDKFPEKHRDAEFLRDRELDARQWATGDTSPRPHDNDGYAARLRLKDKRFREKYEQDDFIISGIAGKLGCNIRQRYLQEGCSFAQNMLSDPGSPQASDLDPIDMALRFHQFFVAGEVPTQKQALIHSCRFRIFLCCKNLLRIPIYIVRLVDIINTYLCRYEPEKRAATLKELTEKNYVFSGPRHDKYSKPAEAYGPILKSDLQGPGDWIMCFDQERVRAPVGDTEADKALLELRKAIQRARRDAIRVILRPREILIVDNQRALTSRREFVPRTKMDILRLIPTVFRWTTKLRLGTHSAVGSTGEDVIVHTKWWFFRPHLWLRVYYAFPIEER